MDLIKISLYIAEMNGTRKETISMDSCYWSCALKVKKWMTSSSGIVTLQVNRNIKIIGQREIVKNRRHFYEAKTRLPQSRNIKKLDIKKAKPISFHINQN